MNSCSFIYFIHRYLSRFLRPVDHGTHWSRETPLRQMRKSAKPGIVQEASQKLCFSSVVERTNVWYGYQQRLCCLKILSVIYKTVNMKFQEAQWILSSCELRQQQKPHCEGFFHPQHQDCGEHPRLCLFSVLCFATYCWETEQFQGKDNLRPLGVRSLRLAKPAVQWRPQT